MSVAGRIAMLVVLWLMAWGEPSLANALTGVAVAVVLLVAFPPSRRGGIRPAVRLRPLGVARLLGYMAWQLVVSNVVVAHAAVSRRSRVRTGVLAHRVSVPTEEFLTTVANLIALTPGTMTVEVTTEPPVVYVHFLLLHDVDDARRQIERLDSYVAGAATFPRVTEVSS